MPGGLTNFGAGLVLKLLLRDESPSLPASFWLRLLTTPSTKGASGTESTYGSYARLEIVRGTSTFSDPALTARSTNSAILTFPVVTSPGSAIVSFDFVNTSSGAFTETYLFGLVTPRIVPTVGKAVRVPIGSLLVTA